MAHKRERTGKIEYLKEGFILHWDEEVLAVEVIDYHATVLRLAWKDVKALAKIASGGLESKSAPPRIERPPPSES